MLVQNGRAGLQQTHQEDKYALDRRRYCRVRAVRGSRDSLGLVLIAPIFQIRAYSS